jgi:hypothetical protein
MKTHLLAILIIVLSIISISSNAQDVFYKGSIIKPDGEKIEGLIKYELTEKDNYHHGIVYKKDKNSNRIYYTAFQLAGFEMETDDYYKSFEIFVVSKDGKTGSLKKKFLKNTITGYLSLYEFKNSNTFRFFIQKGSDGELIEVLREEGSAFISLVNRHQGNMDKVRAILEDCESVAMKFNNEYLQDLNRKSIRRMVVEYNECKLQKYTLNDKSKYPTNIAIGGMYNVRFLSISPSDNLMGFLVFTDFYHKIMGKSGNMTFLGEYATRKGVFYNTNSQTVPIDTFYQKNYMRLALTYNYHPIMRSKFDPYVSLGIWHSYEIKKGELQNDFLFPFPYLAAGINYHLLENVYLKAEYSSFIYFRFGAAYKF